MTLTIKEVSPHIPLPDATLDIYITSFPPDERRMWTHESQVRAFMTANPRMRMRVVIGNDKVVGLLIYWHLMEGVVYVEHLATHTDVRGHGIGAMLMQSLSNMQGTSIILEVEPPIDSLSRRRIGFYKRLGLILHDIDYMQPPYSPNLMPVSLKLMSTPDINADKLETQIIPALKEIVYASSRGL